MTLKYVKVHLVDLSMGKITLKVGKLIKSRRLCSIHSPQNMNGVALKMRYIIEFEL